VAKEPPGPGEAPPIRRAEPGCPGPRRPPLAARTFPLAARPFLAARLPVAVLAPWPAGSSPGSSPALAHSSGSIRDSHATHSSSVSQSSREGDSSRHPPGTSGSPGRPAGSSSRPGSGETGPVATNHRPFREMILSLTLTLIPNILANSTRDGNIICLISDNDRIGYLGYFCDGWCAWRVVLATAGCERRGC